VSQFIRAFLGGDAAWMTYARLRRRFATAAAIVDAPVTEIAVALGSIAHATERAAALKLALGKIRTRAGALDLEFLRTLDVDTALVWLEQIPGVGRVIAAATLNFSTLRRRALVVDADVIRVMERFGFIRRNARTEEAYATLMSAAHGLDAGEVQELNWLIKRHAQKTCTADRAACESCPLADLCIRRLDEPPPFRRAA
jgi:endonuclease-3